MTRRELYLQGPGLAVAVSGAAIARGYFRREYGEAAAARAARPQIELDACFARPAEGRPGAVVEGRHKLARWQAWVELGEDGVALHAHVRGPFGLPLVQSLILEPLMGVVAARHALALVPGALLLDGEGRGVLLVGGSGAGKTSLAARALAAGRDVLADDRVFLGADAGASRYVRRMRLYPDIRATAPTAWASLAGGGRAKLRAVELLGDASGGRFAPPVAVTRRELGAPPPPTGTAIHRILLLRREEREAAQMTTVQPGVAVDEMAQRIADDRAALDGPALRGALRALARDDCGVLEGATTAVTAQRLEIPVAWPAARSVQRLAEELGIP